MTTLLSCSFCRLQSSAPDSMPNAKCPGPLAPWASAYPAYHYSASSAFLSKRLKRSGSGAFFFGLSVVFGGLEGSAFFAGLGDSSSSTLRRKKRSHLFRLRSVHQRFFSSGRLRTIS